ncbi:MAG: hypothetical protein IKP10_00225 [Clostridia bacterium]|nr:hypothetical protein [Clostridia bacterium]
MNTHEREAERLYDSKIRSEQTDLLMQAMLTLKDEEEAYRFFEDLCTIAEIKSLAQRLTVACRLREGVRYQDIARETGASTATISRVNRAKSYGADGYDLVLERLAESGRLPTLPHPDSEQKD